MPKQAMKNLHVPLPEDLYDQLKNEADRAHVPTTKVARYAIESWCRQKRHNRIEESLAEYVSHYAGTPQDLDKDLEAAAIEHLLRDNEDDT